MNRGHGQWPGKRRPAAILAVRAQGRTPGVDAYLGEYPGREALIRETSQEVMEDGRAQETRSDPVPAAEDNDRRIGPYRQIRPLGGGGQGEVCLADDRRHRRRVAIKVLHAIESTSE